MDTLILGHEYSYEKEDIRCSPINVNLWYDKPFKCVDFMCANDSTDFNYDIFRSIDYRYKKKIRYQGKWIWKFAEDNSYDTIIDCTGSIHFNKEKNEYMFQDDLLKTIFRILRTNGKFYSYFGIYTKINDALLLERKKRNGYQYTDI